VEPDETIDLFTSSVSDGTPVDWEEGGSELDPHTVEALRDVSRIADFHRALQRTGDPPPAGETSAPSSPAPLERWHDLTLLERIGAGARGEVWRAWDATLQRQVALKFLQPSAGAGDRTGSAALLKEARALARVRHPSIVAVFGIAEDQERVGMWMECVQGITLAREIERVGALPAGQVTRIGLQLCSALETLDAAGLVHRDIKPTNIMIEGTERVILTDFGLGWRPALDDSVAPKSSGTPLFMAPEVLAGEKSTHQSDLYALGVTLWWALAGQGPFEAKTLDALRKEVPRGPSRSLAQLSPQAPPDLVEAILWAMKPLPSDRVRSAADLAARLRTSGVDFEAQAPRAPAIAVLPFVNNSPGNEDEYFADSLADELINVLAKVRGLRVVARASSFQFKGRREDVGVIGAKLKVPMLLDGSLRKSGNRIRVSVQLVRVSDSSHLWSETYDRTLEDIFAVQDDIAHSVVKELRTALLGDKTDSEASAAATAAVVQAAKGRGTDSEAHRLYLLARHLLDRSTPEETEKAIGYLKEALARDAGAAIAWRELGRAYAMQSDRVWVPVAEGYIRAREAVERALDLEPDLPEAHAELGWIQLFYYWDFAGAQASLRRAVELSPGNAAALRGAGVLAWTLGRHEEAIGLTRRALEQDPLSAASYHNLALALQIADRLAEAEAAYRKALEIAPRRAGTRAWLSLTLTVLGRGEEALAEAMQEPDEAFRLWALGIVRHALGDRAGSDAALEDLIEKNAADSAYQVAEVYGARGERDKAFEWLERAYVQRDGGIADMKISQSLRSLHGDSRWGPFLRKMGLE